MPLLTVCMLAHSRTSTDKNDVSNLVERFWDAGAAGNSDLLFMTPEKPKFSAALRAELRFAAIGG
jgi:hypothetical protein